MDYQTLKNKYELKELELNSLLEITQAINNNLPEELLYRIYNFTLMANLNIRKLALYVLDESWLCKVNYGTTTNFYETPIERDFLSYESPTPLRSLPADHPFREFEIAIPVLHKKLRLALVFASGVNPDEESLTKHTNTTFLEALSNIIIVAIENKKLARRQLRQEAIRRELEIAKDVQNFLFPDNLPYGVRLKVEASYLPHHSVGGDYYDYIPINQNQFLLCIADVSGKGVPAAIIMSNFQASLRTLVRQTSNLTEIIQELNFLILENAKGENFITFFAAIYDHQLNTLVYVNAGHNPPVLFDDSGQVQQLTEGTTVLGAFHPLPFINEGFLTDLTSFLFFLYTDGITETNNDEGEEFGEERLKAYLAAHREDDLRDLHSGILDEVDQYRGNNGFADDITILSCRVDP